MMNMYVRACMCGEAEKHNTEKVPGPATASSKRGAKKVLSAVPPVSLFCQERRQGSGERSNQVQ